MKVGIITFVKTINYGASLQAFALQEILKDFECEPEIINYINEDIKNKEISKGRINFKNLIKKLVIGKGIPQKIKKFSDFEDKYFSEGKKLTISDITTSNDYYDCFITGSDQVWNPLITNNDPFYFLSFVKDNYKKISYAPSFGNSPNKDLFSNDELNYLKSINHLSVREKSGQDFIKDVIDIDSTVVLDPTLLLNKEKWISLFSFKPKYDHYILVYFPHNKKKVFSFVNKLKKKYNLPVIYLSISPKIQFGVETIYASSPDEFVGWIYHADFVVTGSFHGTAFSINLEKQFFYEPHGNGSRIDNIVRMCGVFDRNIENINVLDDTIDYNVITPKLNLAREKSYNWLKQAVNDVKNHGKD